MIAEQMQQEINVKLKNNAYNLGWTVEQYKANRDKYNAENQKLKDKFKHDLKNYMYAVLGKGVSDEQIEAVFSYCWDLGHSSGFSEVWLHYYDIVELLSKFITGRKI